MHSRLLTPGPTSVPPQTLSAMAEPVIHHRTTEFREVLAELHESLQYLFRTQQEVYTIVGSGTAAFEAGLTTALGPGATVLNITCGKFSERWAALARNFTMKVTEQTLEYGNHITPTLMEQFLDEDQYGAVVITHSETSTATACDLQAVARVIRARAPETLIVIDGITSIGAIPFDMDEWEVDVAVTGSQKALMTPPGLGFVSLSQRAWKRAGSSEPRQSFYLDLRRYREAWTDSDAPFTTAVPLVKGANVSLKLLRAEGLERAWKRTRAHAEATRRGMAATGLQLFSRMPADSVSAFCYPPGIDDGFRKRLETEHGMVVAGGQGSMSGKLFRVNHMGYTDAYEALACVAATEHVLTAMGYPVPPGAGVAAAQKALGDWFATG